MNPNLTQDKEKVVQVTPTTKMAFIRRTPSTLYMDIEKWVNSLGINEIISHQMSESNGYITITLFYK